MATYAKRAGLYGTHIPVTLGGFIIPPPWVVTLDGDDWTGESMTLSILQTTR